MADSVARSAAEGRDVSNGKMVIYEAHSQIAFVAVDILECFICKSGPKTDCVA